jgi:hypothetical protein
MQNYTVPIPLEQIVKVLRVLTLTSILLTFKHEQEGCLLGKRKTNRTKAFVGAAMSCEKLLNEGDAIACEK